VRKDLRFNPPETADHYMTMAMDPDSINARGGALRDMIVLLARSAISREDAYTPALADLRVTQTVNGSWTTA
jgi:acetamidase/formamidase